MSITRFRGDTKGFSIYITDKKGNAVDIASCDLLLSVSAVENPADVAEADYKMQIAGAPRTPTTLGIFDIVFTDADVDFIGNYFYDVQYTDADGKIATLDKSTWEMVQDISK